MPRRQRAPLPKGPAPKQVLSRSERLAVAAGPAAEPHRPPNVPRRRPQRDPDPGFVAVGRVLGPFGLKGELKVEALTENAARFAPGSKLHAGREAITVAHSRQSGRFLYIALRDHPDRTSVERFRHALLQVPEADLPPPPAGEYYRFQLLGLNVVDRGGNALGALAEVLETGANDVYRVRTPDGRDILLAATAEVILDIDLHAKRMTVDPPDWR